MMKLSAALNLFDGGELLIPVLKSIRPAVEHISVTFQDVSNYGNPISAVSRAALEQVRSLGLADNLVPYTPDLAFTGGINEFRKRAIGVACAREAGATHIMFCDVDEFYVAEELTAAKRFIVENSIDFSSVTYVNYYRRPTLKLVSVAGSSVPDFHTAFICRLSDQTSHSFDGWYPLEGVDPTRRIHVSDGRHHVIASGIVTMHHMTGVRVDIEEKLLNSSCNDDPEMIRQIRDNFTILHMIEPGSYDLPNGWTVQFEEVADQFDLADICRW